MIANDDYTSTMTTSHAIKQQLQELKTEICGKKEVDVNEIIGRLRNIKISGDPKTFEEDLRGRNKTDPVTSALSYILAVSMHRRFSEPKPKDSAYCFHKIFLAIHEFQKEEEHRKLLKNDATTDSVTDILIKLTLEMYKAEFRKLQEKEGEALEMNQNLAAIGYAATWITATCLENPRWVKEADQFYEIGVRFEKATGNLEDLARLYNSRAKYLAMIGDAQEEVNRFFKLAEDTVGKMPESDRKTKNKLLGLITESRLECEKKCAFYANLHIVIACGCAFACALVSVKPQLYE